MTRDRINEWARVANLSPAPWDAKTAVWVVDLKDLTRFAALVAKHEREQCAELCELWDATHPQRLAAAIRARSEK